MAMGQVANMDNMLVALLFTLIAILTIFIRILFVLTKIYETRKSPFISPSTRDRVKTLIVAGSGGHTKEILTLMGTLGNAYSPRRYIVADTDHMSKTKIENLERSKGPMNTEQVNISIIPRSREVSQSWISTVWTTIVASLYSFPIVLMDPPDLILVNGPGTCIPVCAAGFLLRLLAIRQVQIVYVESVCRVKTLSLSGKILYYFADQILVQWPYLKDKYPLTLYMGRLV